MDIATSQHLTQYSGMRKYEKLLQYSDPKRVLAAARRHGYDPNSIYVSPLATKKYMAIDPQGKRHHFGTMNPPMEDYTKHRDKERRDNFRKRNAKWAAAAKWTGAHLAYFTLW